MRRLLALLFLLPAISEAETLVRHCVEASATGCARAVYVRPADASIVVVLRGTTSPWVPLSQVQPTERISVCVDDSSFTAGQPGPCTTRIPGRTDNWQLKSIVYPVIAPPAGDGHITVVWQAVSTDLAGAAFDGTAGYRVNRQRDVCTTQPPDPRCGTEPWVSEDVGNVTRRVFILPQGRYCFTVQGYLATGEGGGITPPDPLLCALTGQTLRLPAAPTNARAISGNHPQ
jgi:hypothetical protein